MLHPDRWDRRCPRAKECTRAELLDFLRVASLVDGFTPWEAAFCLSLRSQLSKGSVLTLRQQDTLDRTKLLYRLWDRDPELWR